MATRLNVARASAAMLGASVALMVAALPASAGTAPTTTATIDYHADTDWGQVTLANGQKPQTVLIGLKGADGSQILTYCVQLTVHEGADGKPMTQVPWTRYPDPSATFKNDPGKINWILHNSFPTVDLATLSKTVDSPKALTASQAVEATQAAIWSLSDGIALNTTSGNDAAVTNLYTYLTTKATSLPQPADKPTLTITVPSSTTGPAGTKIGPFTVNTNLDAVTLDSSQVPAGVKVEAMDASGKVEAANAVTNGSQVFFDVPATNAPASGTFKVGSSLQLGQLFVGQAEAAGADNRSTPEGMQSLIVAQSSKITASSSASWTAPVAPSSSPAPTTTTAPIAAQGGGQLANTGVSIAAPISLAVVLIGAGGAFLLVQRRRSRA